MKKKFFFVIMVLNIALLSGCTAWKAPEMQADEGIDFEYFYRGFTPLKECDSAEKILGTVLIASEEDWNCFTQNYCEYAGFFAAPDFSEKYLVVSSRLYGAKSTANCSFEVDAVTIENDEICTLVKEASCKDIYCINKDGYGHLFLNVLVIEKSAVAGNIKNTFRGR